MEKDSEQTDKEIAPAIHTSFVLRCWVSEVGGVRGRLVDVRTGNAYPLAALEQLPEMVSGLLKPLSGPENKGDKK